MEQSDSNALNIRQSFLIIGILLIISLAVSVIQLQLLSITQHAKSWIVLFSYILQFTATIIIACKILNIRITDMKRVSISVCALSIILVLALALISESITSLIPMPDVIAKLFEEALQINFPGFLAVGIAAPILEELLFRGLILGGLLRRYKPAKAIIWSAVIFGIAHLNPWQFIAAFIIGCAIGWLFWKTGSIWIGIILHFVNNSTSFLLAYLNGDAIDISVIELFGDTTNQIIALSCCILLSILIPYTMDKWIFKTDSQVAADKILSEN